MINRLGKREISPLTDADRKRIQQEREDFWTTVITVGIVVGSVVVFGIIEIVRRYL